MVTQWIILLSVASLALCVTLRGYERKKRDEVLSWGCCDYSAVVPLILTIVNSNCADSVRADGEDTCEGDCGLVEHGLLNEGRSIDKAELRKKFMEKVPLGAEDVLKEALDKCFADSDDEEEEEDDSCKSPADDLFVCIQNEVATNCPDEFWSADQRCTPTAAKN